MSWIQNGTPLPETPVSEQNPDGTYSTRHYLTMTPEQRSLGGMMECAVSQPGVVHSANSSENLEKLDPKGMGFFFRLT